MTKLSRQVLKDALQMVKPALSSDDFIQIMTCFCFSKDFIFAYDNVLAIAWPLDSGVSGAVAGDALLKVVSSLSAKEVDVSLEDDSFLLKSGRSNFKSASMLPEKFVIDPMAELSVKKSDDVMSLQMNESFFDGLDKCMVSVGDDPLHPAHMGLSIEGNGRQITMHSTDNRSLSRYRFSTKRRKFKQQVLPVKFCQQVLAMRKHFENAVLDLSNDFVGVWTPSIFKGKRYVVLSKLLYTGEGTDFKDVVERFSKGDLQYFPVPAALSSCLERSLIVLSNDMDKKTEVSVTGNAIKLHTVSSMGVADDKIMLRGIRLPGGSYNIITDLVLRACKIGSSAAFGDNGMAFKDKNFLHLVSYMRG